MIFTSLFSPSVVCVQFVWTVNWCCTLEFGRWCLTVICSQVDDWLSSSDVDVWLWLLLTLLSFVPFVSCWRWRQSTVLFCCWRLPAAFLTLTPTLCPVLTFGCPILTLTFASVISDVSTPSGCPVLTFDCPAILTLTFNCLCHSDVDAKRLSCSQLDVLPVHILIPVKRHLTAEACHTLTGVTTTWTKHLSDFLPPTPPTHTHTHTHTTHQQEVSWSPPTHPLPPLALAFFSLLLSSPVL